MSKSQSGYEVRLTLWVPADFKDRAQIRIATQAVDALESLNFEELLKIEGVVVEKIETKSRFISKRAAE